MKRAQGTPGACCTRGLVCKIVRRNAHEHTGTVGAFRHSLRNGFTAYAALSPATNSSCHRHRRIKVLRTPGWARKTSADLTPATGARTTRFCRTQPPVFANRLRPKPDFSESRKAQPGFGAVVLRNGYRSRDKPALRIRLTPTLPRPPHPAPTFVTMANAPLLGPGWGELVALICPTG